MAVFEHHDAATAMAAAERLRVLLAESPFQDDGVSLSMTVSVGVAILADGDASFTALLRRADQALYQAKAQGRNRVVLASQPLL